MKKKNADAGEPMNAPRITALRELAQEAELERRDFLYEATEQLRRFIVPDTGSRPLVPPISTRSCPRPC